MSTNEHQELYNYLNNLSERELYELFKVEIDEQAFNEITSKYRFKEGKGSKCLFIKYFLDNLAENENKPNDDILIENCERALKGLKENPGSYSDYKIGFTEEEDDDLVNISRFDNLSLLLLRYNILPVNNVFIDSVQDDIKKHSIVNVIENKIRFKHVINQIENYINRQYENVDSDLYVLGETAKKFNLNFRIHKYNEATKKEVIERKDNDGWIIKQKPTQIKFEVGKIGYHYFTYEKLFIPRKLLKNTNKLLAYFMVVGQFNTSALYNQDLINDFIKKLNKKIDNLNTDDYLISSLDLIVMLRKLNLVGRLIRAVGKETYDNFTYFNDKISEHGILKSDVFLNAFRELNDEDIIKTYYELFNS